MSLRSFILAASCLLPCALTPAKAVVFASSAYGTSIHIAAASTVQADSTAGAVSGTAGPAYALSGGVASVNQSATLASNILSSGSDTLTTGLITTSASSNGPDSNAATASASVANASFGLTNELLSTLALSNLLNLNTGLISSTTSVGIDGNGMYGTGASLLTGLDLSGSLLGSTGINGSLYSAPAANTVLLSLAGLRVILNEQVSSVTSSGLSMQTNAVHIALNNYALDGSLLNGDIILGHSAASVGGVPEPASWAMMIVGMGMVGALLRRRRPSPLFT